MIIILKQGSDTDAIKQVEAKVRELGYEPHTIRGEVRTVVAAVGDAVGPVAFSSLCASREWLAGDMAAAFMRAYRNARRYVIDAPADEIARQEAGFFPDIDPQVLATTIAGYQQLGCWTPDPAISEQAYDNLLEVFLYSGAITRRHPRRGNLWRSSRGVRRSSR